MANWTSEQNQAITIRNKNILVSAAAGSGKTAVLVERIYSLIQNENISIEDMLVVTFTNAAASEMRERILKRLKDGLLEKDSIHIRKQINHVGRAAISTIHSFCIELLRRHFHVLGLDPNFKIGDETELNILRENSVEQLMEELYENITPELEALIETYTGNKSDKELSNLIMKIYGFMNSKVDPWQWLSDSIKQYKLNKEEYIDSIIYKEYLDEVVEEIENIYRMAEINQRYVDENGLDEYIEAARGDIEILESILEYRSSLEILASNLNEISYIRLKAIKKDRKEEVGELAESYKLMRDKFKKSIDVIKKRLKDFDIDEEIRYMNEMYPRLLELEKLIFRYHEIYSDNKSDRELLDFNDLEHFTLKLLQNTEVSESEMGRYKYIFLDEYQDTNEVQEYIISKIKRADNLFQVGDVKQSIYRFRLADPSIFIDKKKKYRQNEADGVVIQLHKNFRSREGILDGINMLFKNIMSESIGEIDYVEEEYLNKGVEFLKAESASIEVSVLHGKSEDEELDESLEDLSKIEKEAYYVANKIKAIVGTTTYDAKNGIYRPVQYGDIVILLRAIRNWAMTFNEILIKEGIPVYVDDSESYLSSLEVAVFINLLKIIDNQNQDIPLLSVLRSPIIGFNTEDLVAIRMEDRDISYYEATLQYIKNNDNELAIKLRSFYQKIEKWQNRSLYLGLSDLFWEILIETDFYNKILAMPGGKQRQSNLRLLIDRAYEFEESMQGSLFDFLRYIDLIAKQHNDLSSAKIIGENEKVVRIMSIHKSKGLEFPVVILSGTGKQFNMMDTRSSFLMHKEYGIATRYMDIQKRGYKELIIQSAFKQKIKRENLSEEMRVLYVAMTRAVDKLIITGFVKNIDKESEKWAEPATNYNISKDTHYIDWIMRTLSNSNEAFNNGIYSVEYINENDILTTHQQNIFTVDDFRKKLKSAILEKDTVDETIKSNLEYIYKYKAVENMPLKIAVTQIDSLEKEKERIQYQKINTNESSNLERGTIIHYIFQKYNPIIHGYGYKNIVKYSQSIKINKNAIEKYFKLEDAKKIECMYESELGKRIIESKCIKREIPFVLKEDLGKLLGKEALIAEEIFIQGIIDCYFEEADGVVIIDYKTGKIGFEKEDIIKDHYRSQMKYYKEAIEKITLKNVKETYLYMIDSNKWVSID